MTMDIGIEVRIKGETPLDDRLKDVYWRLHSLAFNSSKQLFVRDFATQNDQCSIKFDIDVILWAPFGNPLATTFWQNIDILMAFESVHLEVKSIVGYKDAC